MGVAKYILDHKLATMEFVHQWVNRFDEFEKSLEPFTLESCRAGDGVARGDDRDGCQ